MNTANLISGAAILLGTMGIFVGCGIVKIPLKENLTDEYKKRELKKILRTGILMILVGSLRILDLLLKNSP